MELKLFWIYTKLCSVNKIDTRIAGVKSVIAAENQSRAEEFFKQVEVKDWFCPDYANIHVIELPGMYIGNPGIVIHDVGLER